MAINFPASPTANQTYTFNGRTWTWNGVGWQATGSTGLTVYTKTDFTATAGQTSFSATYTVGFVDVYYNGSKLSTSEYTATTGSTVVLGTACALGDIVETVAWTISSSFNPSLGSASATSLALGGATIGTNALAVTGTSTFSSTLTGAAANFSGNVNTTSNGGFSVTASAATKAFYGLFSSAGVANYIGAELRADETSGLQFFQTSTTYNTAASTLLLPANVASSGQIWNNRGKLILGAANGSIDFYSNSQTTVTASITSAGLGIGMTPSNVLDITQSQNAASSIKILNSNGGANAATYIQLANGTQTGYVQQYGTGKAADGIFIANGMAMNSGGGQLALLSGTALCFGVNGSTAEVARFATNGMLQLIGTSTSAHTISGTASQGFGLLIMQGTGTGGYSGIWSAVAQNNYNGANCANNVGRDSGTGRSINAGGTINASGADYAEYMLKSDGCGILAKGAVVGVDADGKLTDKFVDAHSFVIKSTDPSYVGGDTWGNGDAVGEKPMPPQGEASEENMPKYEAALAEWTKLHEASRAKVDRIAFSGQVPVNVTGATVGDYIVPVAGPDGGIAGEAVTNPTFDQYRATVGRVWKILEDGRAFVSVKVS